MSYFKNFQTEFTDQESILGALGRMDLQKKTEILTSPRKLMGYGTASADIVLPRQSFGNYYEAGFSKQSDGTFTFIAADDDMHRFDQNKMKREYSVSRSMALAKSRGMAFKSRTDGVDKDNQPLVKLFFAANVESR